MKEDVSKIKNLVDGYLLKPASKLALISELIKFLPHENPFALKFKITKNEQNINEFEQELKNKTIPEEFINEFETWYKASETARKSLNTVKLKKFMEEFILISEKYNLDSFKNFGNQIINLIYAFAIVKISEKLRELDSCYKSFIQK
jgi:hypothetical protein